MKSKWRLVLARCWHTFWETILATAGTIQVSEIVTWEVFTTFRAKLLVILITAGAATFLAFAKGMLTILPEEEDIVFVLPVSEEEVENDSNS